MDKPQNIAILGYGLMGASLSLGLRKRGFTGRILGYARREETRSQALELNIADAVFADPAEAVREADIIVICVPIWTMRPYFLAASMILRPSRTARVGHFST